MDEPTGFDKIAGSNFGRREASGRRPAVRDGRSNPTLSAICSIKIGPFFGPIFIERSRVCGRTHRVRQNCREQFWTTRSVGPKACGQGWPQQSHPLRHLLDKNRAVLRPHFYRAEQGVWTNPPGSTKLPGAILDDAKRRAEGLRPGMAAAIPPSPPVNIGKSEELDTIEIEPKITSGCMPSCNMSQQASASLWTAIMVS